MAISRAAEKGDLLLAPSSALGVILLMAIYLMLVVAVMYLSTYMYLHTLPSLIPMQSLDGSIAVIPMLQMRKLSLTKLVNHPY